MIAGAPYPPWLTLLSFAAGAINALSTVPALVAPIFRKNTPARRPNEGGQLLRNIAQATGNTLWVIFGALTGNSAIVVFCSLNAILVAMLSIRYLRSRRPDS